MLVELSSKLGPVENDDNDREDGANSGSSHKVVHDSRPGVFISEITDQKIRCADADHLD